MSNVLNQSLADKLHLSHTVQSLIGTKTVMITPELAKQWLEWNDGNRKPTGTHISYLAKEIKNGNWMLNGQCLVFSDTGRLLDGQHRLNAIVQSDTSVLMDVRFGVDPDSFKTIDQGKRRSAADVLGIKGYKNYTTIAAAAAIVMNYNSTGKGENRTGAGKKPSNSDILSWVEQNPSIQEDVKLGGSLYLASDKTILSSAKIAAYLFLTKKLNEQCEKFWTLLCTGVPMNSRGTVYQLRRTLIRARLDKTRRLPRPVEHKLVVIAWNAWNRGDELSSIQPNRALKSKKTKFK